MARKRQKGFVVIPFTASVALSTLNDTIVLSDVIITMGEDLFIISVDALWTIHGLTAGDTPIDVGFSHGDLTVTEIGEALDANLSDPDDIIQKERSRRPVRRAGTFAGSTATEFVLNDGKTVRTRVKFSVGDGHSFRNWARNISGANLQTGAVLQCNGKLFGRWQR